LPFLCRFFAVSLPFLRRFFAVSVPEISTNDCSHCRHSPAKHWQRQRCLPATSKMAPTAITTPLVRPFQFSGSTNLPSNSPFCFINLLKAVSAQLIVLHHLAFYGPMADRARSLASDLIDWLGSDARIAVQVFLVIGGFLAAKSLCPKGNSALANPLQVIWRRYAKLVPPFLAATALAIVASALAERWMDHYSISAPPHLPQLLAHAFLLQDILGYESMSAGAWYVAIDFQLYASTAFLLWWSGNLASTQRMPWLRPALIAAVISASLLYFNRDADWDAWAVYFFGSYGLGMLAWWAGDRNRQPASTLLLLATIVLPTLAALAIDFRSRIALALAVACLLVLAGRIRLPAANPAVRLINRLGRISYSVFLVHFPVCLIVNAAFTRFAPAEPVVQAGGMLLAWMASLAVGAAFHHWVELPLGRLPAPASPIVMPTLRNR
jgi:peptidoglycan/LPS O-acetylase OafA/YrhL